MFANTCHFVSPRSYLRFYGLDLPELVFDHRFIRFGAAGYTLTGQVFEPPDYEQTVILLHGFFGHCGLLTNIIRFLLEAGYAAAVFDLPGHGLSTGRRLGIDDFSQYADVLDVFLEQLRSVLHGPYHLVGHSLGAAAVVEYLLSNKPDVFEEVILVAPLLHCRMWTAAKIGYRLYRRSGLAVPRVFRHCSNDPEFLRFVRHQDPLQARKIPTNWLHALFEWNRRIAACRAKDRPIHILQGTKDHTVAWQFNLRFLQGRFHPVSLCQIKDGRHELWNDAADIRLLVFRQIHCWLRSGAIKS